MIETENSQQIVTYGQSMNWSCNWMRVTPADGDFLILVDGGLY